MDRIVGCTGCGSTEHALSRRTFLGMSLGTTLSWLLHSPLRAGEDVTVAVGRKTRKKSCILLWMDGGPSHLETFDPKPGTSDGGPYKTIPSTVPGLGFVEHLPRLAQQAKHLTLVRSMTTRELEHGRARYYFHSGYKREGSTDHPGFGSLVARNRRDLDCGHLPKNVVVGYEVHGRGFLGPETAPFVVPDPSNPPPELFWPEGMSSDGVRNRVQVYQDLDREFLEFRDPQMQEEQDKVRAETLDMMASRELRAFRLEEEPAPLRDQYGRNGFGQGCLLARRLVETGVPFVEVVLGGWDGHRGLHDGYSGLLRTLDAGFSTLLEDLKGRGLLQDVLVVWAGEFGRTPEINKDNGRDHYGEAFCSVIAGAGLSGGRTYGKTCPAGANVIADPVTVPDLLATACTVLGIDPHEEYLSPDGRPIKIVDKGKVIRKLLA